MKISLRIVQSFHPRLGQYITGGCEGFLPSFRRLLRIRAEYEFYSSLDKCGRALTAGRKCHVSGTTFSVRTVFGSVENGVRLRVHGDCEFVLTVLVERKGVRQVRRETVVSSGDDALILDQDTPHFRARIL